MKQSEPADALSTGVRLHRAGRYAEAAAEYRQVLRKNPRNSDALRLLGALACQSGNPDEGLRLLKKAAKANPQDPNVHLDLATALAGAGRQADAIAGYRVAARLAPKSVVAWAGLACALAASRRAAEAVDAFGQAIALDPDDPNLHVGLGNALKNLGKFSEAFAAYRRAVTIRPDYAEVYSNLGNVATAMGDLDEAIASHRRAVELRPDLAQAHHNLGATYQTARRFAEAAAAFRQALDRNPGGFDTLFNLGAVLKELGRLEESLDCLLQAHGGRPGDLDCSSLAVQVLRELRRPVQILERLNEGIPDPATRADAEAALANALETMNSRDQAKAVAERALAIAPEQVLANVVIARLERHDGNPAAARDRLLRLAEKGKSLGNAGYTVLGQAHDRLGACAQAFAAFAAGKKCTADAIGDDVANWQDHFSDRIRRFRGWYDAERAAGWPPPDAAEARCEPIFFVGFPRSGTTLFEQMLDSHPDLATTGETQILGRLQLILPSLLGRRGESPEILDSLEPAEVSALRRWYGEETARYLGPAGAAKRIVDKMPLNIVEIGFIRRIFPKAPIIVALRDPRDVVLSCFMQNFNVNPAMAHFLTLEGTAKLYAAVMDLWLHYRQDRGLHYVEYRYEDLVADVEGVARRIFAFIGVPWDDAVLQYQKRARERFVRTPSYADVAAPLYTRSIGRWRKYREQLAPVLPILAGFVREFGYEES